MNLTTVTCDPTDGSEGHVNYRYPRRRRRRCETCIVDATCERTCDEVIKEIESELFGYVYNEKSGKAIKKGIYKVRDSKYGSRIPGRSYRQILGRNKEYRGRRV